MAGSKKDTADQTFTFETVAVLLAILAKKGATPTTTDFKLMAALDGKRSESSFEHTFRAVKLRAKALAGQVEDGDAAATPTKGKKATPGGKGETGAAGKRSTYSCDTVWCM
ncbi:hypothetical protein LTR53_011841, partial [Teratosphaeriaceae sp. CCFEE 6253]